MTRICVAVCEKTVAALESAAVRASESADVVELRVDCLGAVEDLQRVLDRLSRPVILTFRPSQQGGHRELDHEARQSFWKTAARTEWWDLEADLASEVVLATHADWSNVIVSHHDFSGVPKDLTKVYERLAATPARVLKIAVHADDIVDCIPVFQLLDRARTEGRHLIAIAMGNAGLPTRILGPSRGSFLTYAALAEERATAPGQITTQKLRSVYHVDTIDQETMICGLVGLPVMHSVSPHMHNAVFRAAGINGVYLPLEVRDVQSFFKRMVHPRTREIEWKLRGLSVTAPHKSKVLESLDWIEPDAKQIGAVNTVVVDNDKLRGFNTDASGFIEPLLKVMGSLRGLRSAVIGAGGAARAATWALLKNEANVTIFARNVEKAHALGKEFDVSYASLSDASYAGYDLVINATPLGSGESIDQAPATAEQLAGAGCVYDLVYNPIETRLLKEACKADCKTVRGLEMLVAQAKNQFELWTGQSPSSTEMYESAAAALGH
ncbi:MAG TPA: shikimate dehydrogenase [Pyrinomonadaceae bacterium]|nr:shikimate dehydrogenase [Pyrinomonadaceae bacterium]